MRFAVLTAAALLLSSTIAVAELNIPPSGEYVVDTAGAIDPAARQQITGWLKELEQKTGAQAKVLTIRSTDGEDIFSFTERQFERWQLGQRGKDDGVLIVLDVGDHKLRIHTGYGLEAALPDSWCGSLSREAAARFFKAGQYSQGIAFVAQAVALRVAQDQGVTLTGVPRQVHQPAADEQVPDWVGLLIVLVILVFIYLAWRNQQRGGSGGGFWGGGPSLGWPWISSGSGWGGSFGGGSSGGSFGGSFGGGGRTGGGGGGASW